MKRNSKKSSKPPSPDLEKGFKPKAKQPRSEKPRGAQFGHEGHETQLYPVEACERVKDYYPERCQAYGGKLTGTDPEPLQT